MMISSFVITTVLLLLLLHTDFKAFVANSNNAGPKNIDDMKIVDRANISTDKPVASIG